MRKRILVFAPGVTEVGGAGRRAKRIIWALRDRGWEVRVITRAGTLGSFRVHRERGLFVLEVPGFGSRRLGLVLFLLISATVGLVWGARSRALIGFQLFSQSLVTASYGWLLRKPFILFGTISGEDSEVAYNLGTRGARVRGALLSRAAFMVAQSSSMAAEMHRLTDPERVKVIPNPVESVDPPPLIGRPFAMYAGRLSIYKGLFTLLEGWKLALQNVPDARLDLVGEGGDYLSVEQELREAVNADDELKRTVAFRGWVDDIEHYYAATDVFILPSTAEGMSNSLVEAMAWGRIVCASDIPQNREAVGDDYPLLFPVGDASALAEKIVMAFSDTFIREQATTQLAERVQRHSVERVMNEIEELLLGI